jgi:hypothetical protein
MMLNIIVRQVVGCFLLKANGCRTAEVVEAAFCVDEVKAVLGCHRKRKQQDVNKKSETNEIA